MEMFGMKMFQIWASVETTNLPPKPSYCCVGTFMHVFWVPLMFVGDVHLMMLCTCTELHFSDAVSSSFPRIIMDEAALLLSDKCNTVTINLNRGELRISVRACVCVCL